MHQKKGDVICCYLYFKKQWEKHNDSPNKLWFFIEHLKLLKESLKELNIPILVVEKNFFSEASSTLFDIFNTYNCSGIWFNNEFGFNEQQRDNLVEINATKACIPVHRFNDQTLFKPGSVLTGSNEYFKVFTPFKKKLLSIINAQMIKPIAKPKKNKQISLTKLTTTIITNPFKPSNQHIQNYWKAGERQAHKILNNFVQKKIMHYEQHRDFPNINGTSTLSPWLNVGGYFN